MWFGFLSLCAHATAPGATEMVIHFMTDVNGDGGFATSSSLAGADGELWFGVESYDVHHTSNPYLTAFHFDGTPGLQPESLR